MSTISENNDDEPRSTIGRVNQTKALPAVEVGTYAIGCLKEPVSTINCACYSTKLLEKEVSDEMDYGPTKCEATGQTKKFYANEILQLSLAYIKLMVQQQTYTLSFL